MCFEYKTFAINNQLLQGFNSFNIVCRETPEQRAERLRKERERVQRKREMYVCSAHAATLLLCIHALIPALIICVGKPLSSVLSVFARNAKGCSESVKCKYVVHMLPHCCCAFSIYPSFDNMCRETPEERAARLRKGRDRARQKLERYVTSLLSPVTPVVFSCKV